MNTTMETVQAFIPFVVLWLGLASMAVLPQLAVTAYRKKAVPDLSALWMLAIGAGAVWLAANDPSVYPSPVFVGIMLFFGGFGGYMAAGLASLEFNSPAQPDVGSRN